MYTYIHIHLYKTIVLYIILSFILKGRLNKSNVFWEPAACYYQLFPLNSGRNSGSWFYLVVFKDSKFHLLSLMFILLRSGVRLLLSFLCPTTKSQHKMKGRFLSFGFFLKIRFLRIKNNIQVGTFLWRSNKHRIRQGNQETVFYAVMKLGQVIQPNLIM